MENHDHHYFQYTHNSSSDHLQSDPSPTYMWDPPPLLPLQLDHPGGHRQLGHEEEDSSELRQALLRALAELDTARAVYQAELRRMESEAARLAALVAAAAAERDELRRQCQSLLLLLHQTPTQTPQNPQHPNVNAGLVVDEEDVEVEVEMEVPRRLPEKGRLVEAVVAAGPLLQTLLLAGPLPRWRHPPPQAPAGGADIPPFNPRKDDDMPAAVAGMAPVQSLFRNSSSVSASSSPESNCGGPMAQQYHNVSSFCL